MRDAFKELIKVIQGEIKIIAEARAVGEITDAATRVKAKYNVI